MYDFTYKKAGSVEDAAAALGAAEDGVLMSGGMTLLPTLKQRLANPSDVIDLGGIAALVGVTVTADSVTVGAMTPHAVVAGDAALARALPGLAKLAGGIGDPQVRNRGTIGGSIANNDPAADYPGAVLGLGATIHTNKRTIAGDDFFTGLFETALEEGEIVTGVVFPVVEKSAYMKFPNPASRYAIAGVFVARGADGVRVAVTGAGATVFRVAEMEQALAADFSPDAIAGITIADTDLNSDIHASAEYRAHLVGVMARRAVAEALG
jgi:aerobic carbon-monoxide dehydrogenase medium subunit